METFVLIAWFVIMGPHGGDPANMRVPVLTEAECKMRAKEIAAPGAAGRAGLARGVDGRPESSGAAVVGGDQGA